MLKDMRDDQKVRAERVALEALPFWRTFGKSPQRGRRRRRRVLFANVAEQRARLENPRVVDTLAKATPDEFDEHGGRRRRRRRGGGGGGNFPPGCLEHAARVSEAEADLLIRGAKEASKEVAASEKREAHVDAVARRAARAAQKVEAARAKLAAEAAEKQAKLDAEEAHAAAVRANIAAGDKVRRYQAEAQQAYIDVYDERAHRQAAAGAPSQGAQA